MLKIIVVAVAVVVGALWWMRRSANKSKAR